MISDRKKTEPVNEPEPVNVNEPEPEPEPETAPENKSLNTEASHAMA